MSSRPSRGGGNGRNRIGTGGRRPFGRRGRRDGLVARSVVRAVKASIWIAEAATRPRRAGEEPRCAIRRCSGGGVTRGTASRRPGVGGRRPTSVAESDVANSGDRTLTSLAVRRKRPGRRGEAEAAKSPNQRSTKPSEGALWLPGPERRHPGSLCLTTVSYAAHTCGRGRRPREDGNTHVGVGMSDALDRAGTNRVE